MTSGAPVPSRAASSSILHDGDRRHAKFMADADLVIHDAQYTPEEYGPKKTWGGRGREREPDQVGFSGEHRSYS